MSIANPLIIIQARMGSSRLPGKVMLEIVDGLNMLEVVLKRLQLCKTSNFHVVIATTEHPRDDVIADQCANRGVSCFRGSEDDVLSRYYLAALKYQDMPENLENGQHLSLGSDILRVTSDCPLIDPSVVDAVYEYYLAGNYDYVSNIIDRTYPRGLDIEVFRFSVLEKIHHIANQPHEREHVTSYIYTHPDEFKIGSFQGPVDYSQYRLTIDTPDDLSLIRKIYQELFQTGKLAQYSFTLELIVSILEDHPDWIDGNSHVIQKYDSQTAYLNSK